MTKLAFALQFCAVSGYTVFLSATTPWLWFDLFGALLKNLPILTLILVQRILDEER